MRSQKAFYCHITLSQPGSNGMIRGNVSESVIDETNVRYYFSTHLFVSVLLIF